MADSSLGSNNPFRRKQAAVAEDAAPPPPSVPAAIPTSSTSYLFDASSQLPTGDQFRTQLTALPHSVQPAPKTSFQKPKIVKKVRVQSPPPSSPESAGIPDIYSETRQLEDESSASSSAGNSDEDETDNPFEGLQPSSIEPTEAPVLQPPAAPVSRPPPSTFPRALRDDGPGRAEGPQSSSPSAGGKGTMNVDAFKRLLLTGQASEPAQASSWTTPPQLGAHQATLGGDAGSITDASSISRQSIFDLTHLQETPRTSHEISEPEDDRHGLLGRTPPKKQESPATLRKKPPPPSSRHGTLIKAEATEGRRQDKDMTEDASEAMSSPPRGRPATPSDVNKPLPPSPGPFSPDGAVDSVFDREAAGKIPEQDDIGSEAVDLPSPRPPTPPNISHAASTTPELQPGSRKPAPPPSRRPHGRSESKVVPAAIGLGVQGDENDTATARSSHESNRSRSSSFRANTTGPVPAPPPPRRPNQAQRSTGAFSSPSAVSFSSVSSGDTARSPADPERSPPISQFPPLSETINSHNSSFDTVPLAGIASVSTSSPAPNYPHGLGGKPTAPPPPPPARNSSLRSSRPASVTSFDAVSRRIVRDKESPMAPPPPPPPRQRGSSKSSMEAPPLVPRRTSLDSVKFQSKSLVEEPEVASFVPEGGQPPVVGSPEPLDLAPDSSAADILADLTALQREVDALRGQFGRDEPPGGA